MLAKTANFGSLMNTFAMQIAAVWLPSQEMLNLQRIRRFCRQVLCGTYFSVKGAIHSQLN